MIEIQGKPGEVRFMIEVTRAATGETEVYEMVGTPETEDDAELREADT